MMDRRQFLRRASLIAAGIVAADQLDVLEMLAPRRLFAGADLGHWEYPQPLTVGAYIPDGGYESILTTPAPIWVPDRKPLLTAFSHTNKRYPLVRS